MVATRKKKKSRLDWTERYIQKVTPGPEEKTHHHKETVCMSSCLLCDHHVFRSSAVGGSISQAKKHIVDVHSAVKGMSEGPSAQPRNKEDLSQLFVFLVCKYGLAFQMADDEDVRQLVGDEMMAVDTMRHKAFPNLFGRLNAMLAQLLGAVGEAQKISILADGWVSKQKTRYLGVMFVLTMADGSAVSYLFGMWPVVGPETGECVAGYILHTLFNFGLLKLKGYPGHDQYLDGLSSEEREFPECYRNSNNSNSILASLLQRPDSALKVYDLDPRIASAASDGGSNMVKAFELLKIPRSHCVNHKLHLAVEGSVKHSDWGKGWERWRDAIRTIRKSGLQRQDFELLGPEDGLQLKDICPTRWNNWAEALVRLSKPEVWDRTVLWVRQNYLLSERRKTRDASQAIVDQMTSQQEYYNIICAIRVLAPWHGLSKQLSAMNFRLLGPTASSVSNISSSSEILSNKHSIFETAFLSVNSFLDMMLLTMSLFIFAPDKDKPNKFLPISLALYLLDEFSIRILAPFTRMDVTGRRTAGDDSSISMEGAALALAPRYVMKSQTSCFKSPLFRLFCGGANSKQLKAHFAVITPPQKGQTADSGHIGEIVTALTNSSRKTLRSHVLDPTESSDAKALTISENSGLQELSDAFYSICTVGIEAIKRLLNPLILVEQLEQFLDNAQDPSHSPASSIPTSPSIISDDAEYQDPLTLPVLMSGPSNPFHQPTAMPARTPFTFGEDTYDDDSVDYGILSQLKQELNSSMILPAAYWRENWWENPPEDTEFVDHSFAQYKATGSNQPQEYFDTAMAIQGFKRSPRCLTAVQLLRNTPITSDILESCFSTAQYVNNDRAGNLDAAVFGQMVMISHNSKLAPYPLNTTSRFWRSETVATDVERARAILDGKLPPPPSSQTPVSSASYATDLHNEQMQSRRASLLAANPPSEPVSEAVVGLAMLNQDQTLSHLPAGDLERRAVELAQTRNSATKPPAFDVTKWREVLLQELQGLGTPQQNAKRRRRQQQSSLSCESIAAAFAAYADCDMASVLSEHFRGATQETLLVLVRIVSHLIENTTIPLKEWGSYMKDSHLALEDPKVVNPQLIEEAVRSVQVRRSIVEELDSLVASKLENGTSISSAALSALFATSTKCDVPAVLSTHFPSPSPATLSVLVQILSFVLKQCLSSRLPNWGSLMKDIHSALPENEDLRTDLMIENAFSMVDSEAMEQKERTEITEWLTARGMTPFFTKKDGNCMFSALSHLLKIHLAAEFLAPEEEKLQGKHPSLIIRHAVVKFVTATEGFHAGLWDGKNSNTQAEAVQRWLKGMLEPTTWGDFHVLVAVSLLWNVEIEVMHFYNGKTDSIVPTELTSFLAQNPAANDSPEPKRRKRNEPDWENPRGHLPIRSRYPNVKIHLVHFKESHYIGAEKIDVPQSIVATRTSAPKKRTNAVPPSKSPTGLQIQTKITNAAAPSKPPAQVPKNRPSSRSPQSRTSAPTRPSTESARPARHSLPK